MTEHKIIAYSLEPVYEMEPGGISSAAVMTCLATGEVLSGMGGGGEFLSPDVVHAFRGRPGCWVLTLEPSE